jgi:hypothetical protein
MKRLINFVLRMAAIVYAKKLHDELMHIAGSDSFIDHRMNAFERAKRLQPLITELVGEQEAEKYHQRMLKVIEHVNTMKPRYDQKGAYEIKKKLADIQRSWQTS